MECIETRVEYATHHASIGAYGALAAAADVTLRHVIEAAERDDLASVVALVHPRTPRQALRWLDQHRATPTPPSSGINGKLAQLYTYARRDRSHEHGR